MFNLRNLYTSTVRSTVIVALILLSHCFIHSAHAQQESEIRINYIEVPETAIEGDEFIVRWDISGVDSVYLRYGSSLEEPHYHSYGDVPSVGELRTSAYANIRGGYGPFNMFFSFQFDGQRVNKITEVDCLHEAFFLNPGVSWFACPYAPTVSQASVQQFENGFMLWVEEDDEIIILSNDIQENGRQQFWFVDDDFEHGRDPISDPTLVPPSGKYQPEYGFGKVWREVEGVRDGLGWAISTPINYETVVQFFDNSTYSPEFGIERWSRYRRLPDGTVLHEQHYHDYDFGPGPIRSLTVDQELDGYAHPNNGIRIRQTNEPVDEGETNPPSTQGVPCPSSGVWPAGCDSNLPPSTNTPTPPMNGAVPCPASGVWPAGCDPNLPPETNTPTPPVNGAPCPTSGVWPAGCVPNSGGTSTPEPSGNDCVIPASGPWPPCATNGDPAPPDTPNNCIIPPSGPWPPCARGG